MTIAAVLWWPHSGGRWLCRTLLGSHPSIHSMVFAHPWFFATTDMTLELDNTTQVHKTRSLKELNPHLQALVASIDAGRIAGLRAYIDDYVRAQSGGTIVGELCMGTPLPRVPDLAAAYAACPDLRIIHLVRDPVDAFPSFATRHELDGDPVKVAGSWLTANARVRTWLAANAPDQHCAVRYEDLVADPRAAIAPVCELLGLSVADEMFANVEQRWGKSTAPDIDGDTTALIRSVAASELAQYGYE